MPLEAKGRTGVRSQVSGVRCQVPEEQVSGSRCRVPGAGWGQKGRCQVTGARGWGLGAGAGARATLNSELSITDCEPPSYFWPPPTAFCFLPSAFCLLLAADCLLRLGCRDGDRAALRRAGAGI